MTTDKQAVMKYLKSSFIFIFFFSLTIFSQSQATTGVIQGTVLDQNGALVPNASVILKNIETNYVRTVTTNEEGFFNAPLMPLGVYEITASAQNFRPNTIKDKQLTLGSTLEISISLEVVSENFTVDSITVQEPANEGQKTLVNDRYVRALPIGRRDFSRFALLTAGVSIVQGPDGDEITINGQKGTANNFSIDGADANSPFFGEQRGGQRPAFTLSLETVKEFNVIPVGASAEFGKTSGGVITAVTKSGTNALRGTAFGYFRNQNLASQNPDAVRANLPTENFRNLQFGGNLGGPLKRDKLFFFAAFERNDGLSKKPNFIDQRLLNIFATRFNLTNEQGIIERTNLADVVLGKLDWQINESNQLTLRHNFSRSEQKNGTFDVPTWARSANAREESNTNSFIAQMISVLSPNSLNEFRFQFARESRPRYYDGPDLPDTSIGTFDGSVSYRFGRPYLVPVEGKFSLFQVTDNFTLISGNHTVKLGTNLDFTKTYSKFIGFARGYYIFAGGTIDQAIQGFTDYVNGTNVGGLSFYLQFAPIGNRSVDEAGTQSYNEFLPAFFAQDSWRIRSNLTLNYGLRWEGRFHPSIINAPQDTAYGQFLSDPRFPSDGTIPDSTDGWQPRVALAWSLTADDKNVLRLGAGLYNASIPGIIVAGARNTDGRIAGNIYRDGSFCQFVTPGCPVYPNVLPTANFVPSNPGVATFSKDFKNPRTAQYFVSFEREFAKDYTFLIAYNLSKTTRLTRFVNRNDPRLYNGQAIFSRADGSGIGELRNAESSARSLFQGLNFNVTKRFSKRFQFQVNYQLGFDRSDDDNERDPFTFRYADPRDFRPEYGWSDRDQRHRFNAFANVELPYGFLLSPIVQFRSAQPTSETDRGTFPNIKRRNTLRLKNEFFTFDLRVSKKFELGRDISLEAIFDAFNVFNNRNQKTLPRPLTFNFDGTVVSGFGDPRQAQIGVRLSF